MFEFQRGLDGTESEFSTAILAKDDVGWLKEIKIIAVPCIGFDDPPLAEQLASGRGRSCRLDEFRNSDQIIGGGCEGEDRGDLFSASVLHPSDSTDCLHPAEPLLDALSDALTEFVTRMTGCAAIYCGSASCVRWLMRGERASAVGKGFGSRPVRAEIRGGSRVA